MFNRNRARTDGVDSTCRECRAEYRKLHAERYAKRDAKNYQENREARLTASRLRHAKNRDHNNRVKSEYYANNKDKFKKYNKEYREKNKEKLLGSGRARSKLHYDRNPEYYAHKKRARSQKIGVIDELLPGEWKAMVEECGNRCIVPGCGVSPVTMDHVVPLSKGGRHHISNLQPLCSYHNGSKGTKVLDWRQ